MCRHSFCPIRKKTCQRFIFHDKSLAFATRLRIAATEEMLAGEIIFATMIFPP